MARLVPRAFAVLVLRMASGVGVRAGPCSSQLERRVGMAAMALMVVHMRHGERWRKLRRVSFLIGRIVTDNVDKVKL